MEDDVPARGAGSADTRRGRAAMALGPYGRPHQPLGGGRAHGCHGLGLSPRRPEAYGLTPMAIVDLVYFGSLREALGRDGERIDPPSHVLTVEDLLNWMSERGEPYRSLLSDHGRIRAAVEREHAGPGDSFRSEEHTSELQSLMRHSYAVFCLK